MTRARRARSTWRPHDPSAPTRVMRRAVTTAILLSSLATAAPAQDPARPAAAASVPLVVGETFTIASRALGEERRINVYVPPRYGADADAPLPFPAPQLR